MKKLVWFLVLPTIVWAEGQIMTEALPVPAEPSSVTDGPYASAHVANSIVASWLNESIVTSFSYDFMNYQQTFQLASNYYTTQGWLELDKRHHDMQDIEQVKKYKLVMSAVAIAPAKLVSQGVVNGVYSWLMEAPYLLVAADSQHQKARKMCVRALIVRSNPEVHYRGLAIDKIAIRYIKEAPPLPPPMPKASMPIPAPIAESKSTPTISLPSMTPEPALFKERDPVSAGGSA